MKGYHIAFIFLNAKAQDLGFEGSLEEFIALISGKDGENGIDGKDGIKEYMYECEEIKITVK